jgi:hypothetical protein
MDELLRVGCACSMKGSANERVPVRCPADTHEALAAALKQLPPAEAWLVNLDAVAE